MNTSDEIFIEFAKEYRREFGEVASDEEIMDAFYRLTNVLRVIRNHALAKKVRPSSCVGNHSNHCEYL